MKILAIVTIIIGIVWYLFQPDAIKIRETFDLTRFFITVTFVAIGTFAWYWILLRKYVRDVLRDRRRETTGTGALVGSAVGVILGLFFFNISIGTIISAIIVAIIGNQVESYLIGIFLKSPYT